MFVLLFRCCIPRLFGKRHRILTTKKALVPSNEETKAKTSAVPLSLAFACPLPASAPHLLRESRLSGNGEETRSRLNRSLSGNTRGPVTFLRSALPRSTRQLSEAYTKELFPCHRICLFAVAKKNTGKTPASQLSIIIKLKWKIWKFMRISLRFWGYRPGAVMLPAHQAGVWITFSASSS